MGISKAEICRLVGEPDDTFGSGLVRFVYQLTDATRIILYLDSHYEVLKRVTHEVPKTIKGPDKYIMTKEEVELVR